MIFSQVSSLSKATSQFNCLTFCSSLLWNMSRFYDRTVANLDHIAQRLHFILRDGTTLSAALGDDNLRPDVLPYAKFCDDFARWASMTPEERRTHESRLRERDILVHGELQRAEAFLTSSMNPKDLLASLKERRNRNLLKKGDVLEIARIAMTRNQEFLTQP
jgi:hypothetical protein